MRFGHRRRCRHAAAAVAAPSTGVPVTPGGVSWPLHTDNGRNLFPDTGRLPWSPPRPRTRSGACYAAHLQDFPAVGARLYGAPGDCLSPTSPPAHSTPDHCRPAATGSPSSRPTPARPRDPRRADRHPAGRQRHRSLGRSSKHWHGDARPTGCARPRLSDRDTAGSRTTQPSTGCERLHPRDTLFRVGLLATSTQTASDPATTSSSPAFTTPGRAPTQPHSRPCSSSGRAPESDRPAAATTARTDTADGSVGRYTVVLASLPARAGALDRAGARLAGPAGETPPSASCSAHASRACSPGYIAIVSGDYPTARPPRAARRMFPRDAMRGNNDDRPPLIAPNARSGVGHFAAPSAACASKTPPAQVRVPPVDAIEMLDWATENSSCLRKRRLVA